VESHFCSREYSTGPPLRPTPPQPAGDPGYTPHAGTKSRKAQKSSCCAFKLFESFKYRHELESFYGNVLDWVCSSFMGYFENISDVTAQSHFNRFVEFN